VTGIRGPGWAKSQSGPSALDGRRGKINEKKRLKVELGYQAYRAEMTLGCAEIKRKFSQFL
jgi:hypothetical protein